MIFLVHFLVKFLIKAVIFLVAMYGRVVPEVPQCSVLEASARLTNRIYAFADSHADRRLMRMAEDNVIDQTERLEFDAILEELQEIVEAALALRCAKAAEGA